MGALVGLLGLSAVVGACGDDDPAQKVTSPTVTLSSVAGPVDPSRWSAAACDALARWLAILELQGRDLAGLATADDPSVVHDQLAAFLRGAVAASAETRDYLDNLGAPVATDGSARSAAAITAEVAQVHGLLEAALSRVEGADPNDVDALARLARDIATVIEQGVAATRVGGVPTTPTELDDAFEVTPSCVALSAQT